MLPLEIRRCLFALCFGLNTMLLLEVRRCFFPLSFGLISTFLSVGEVFGGLERGTHFRQLTANVYVMPSGLETDSGHALFISDICFSRSGNSSGAV